MLCTFRKHLYNFNRNKYLLLKTNSDILHLTSLSNAAYKSIGTSIFAKETKNFVYLKYFTEYCLP